MQCKICKKSTKSFYYLRDYSGLKHHVCEKCFKDLQVIKEIDSNFIYGNNIPISSEVCLYFRGTIGKWKQGTFAHKKTLIGKINDIKSINTAHHFYKRYYDLLINAHKYLNIKPKNNLKEYTTEELKNITELLGLLHWYYGQGCAMTEEHHELYHKIYGKDKVDEKSIIDFYFSISNTYGKAYKKIISLIEKNRNIRKRLLYADAYYFDKANMSRTKQINKKYNNKTQ